MIKRLIQNTIVSIIAFGGAALLGLLVIPVIIRHWGVTEFGLIVIARLLIPTGMMAVFDLGLSEVATQAVARAREHRDWNLVARQLTFLNMLSLALAGVTSCAIWFGASWFALLMKIDAIHLEQFSRILHVTALANLILVPSLVFEGVVKGFERYNLLRLTELSSTTGYVTLTIWASNIGASFEIVAFIYLGSLVLRALVILVAALVALGVKHARPTPWTSAIRRELFYRCMLLLQGKLIGGITGPIQPFLVGIMFGPSSVGIYDAVVRLSRVSKVVVGLLTSALLPVASRLDQRGNKKSFQRLGEFGLLMLPMFTVPPLAAAAVLSYGVMDVWIGKSLLPYAFWMGLSFLIPICTQYLAIGNLLFLTKPDVQARLNFLLGVQLGVWMLVSAATLLWLSERALILGQVVASLIVLPWQLETLQSALGLARLRFILALGKQAAIISVCSGLLWIFTGYIQADSVLRLSLISGTFCLLAWLAQYFLVLENRHRAIFPEVMSLMGVTSRRN